VDAGCVRDSKLKVTSGLRGGMLEMTVKLKDEGHMSQQKDGDQRGMAMFVSIWHCQRQHPYDWHVWHHFIRVVQRVLNLLDDDPKRIIPLFMSFQFPPTSSSTSCFFCLQFPPSSRPLLLRRM
jgi:hypothetical protein